MPKPSCGWALFDLFISVRLVLDTGMNAFGWTLEEARDSMRENAFQSATEIATETLRYSTDMPGQALAYKAGLEKLVELRAAAREAAGEEFSLADFHRVALDAGPLPMEVFEERVERAFAAPGG